MEKKLNVYRVLVRKLEDGDSSKDLGVNWSIILKCTFKM
jgi:hypothetical protein